MTPLPQGILERSCPSHTWGCPISMCKSLWEPIWLNFLVSILFWWFCRISRLHTSLFCLEIYSQFCELFQCTRRSPNLLYRPDCQSLALQHYIKAYILSFAFEVFVLFESLLVLLYLCGFKLLDVVEYEIIKENVVCLFLVSDLGAALGAFVEEEEVFC